MKILEVADFFRGKSYRVQIPDDVDFKREDKILIQKDKDLVVTRTLAGARTLKNLIPDKNISFVQSIDPDEFSEFLSLQDGEMDRVLEARKLAEKYQVPMFFFASKIGWKKSNTVFFFTSDNPVDFRNLLQEMIQKFPGRLQLERVTVRDRARITDQAWSYTHLGYAPFLHVNHDKVPITVLKEQGIAINNNQKIYDVTGRPKQSYLFEADQYRECRKYMPRLRQSVKLKDGRNGVVVGLDILNFFTKVVLENETIETVSVADLEFSGKKPLPDIPPFHFDLQLDLEPNGID